MALKISMLSKLETTKNFKLVAGAGGLEKTIDCTEILDFEFDDEGQNYRKERAFDGNSIVLTSFIYAKGKPELVIDSIKRLIAYDVHALAYKPVVYKTLPEEALRIADAMDFPIFVFESDVYMENIILEINSANLKDHNESIKSLILESIIKGSHEENPIISQIMNQRYCYASALCLKVKDVKSIEEKLKFSIVGQYIKRHVFIGLYDSRLIILIAQDDSKREVFENTIYEIASFYNFSLEMISEAHKGWSHIESNKDNITDLIREAYWAENIAEIEEEKVKYYENVGIYKLITHHAGDKKTVDFAFEYLKPILEDEGKDNELLQTGISYVFAGGDVNIAANKLFCHKNTIRYRINKIQEKLDPVATEAEFFTNLTIAIKIYLLNRYSNK
ncbi:MAG: PucR family transcriptional regulator [Eubacterium sp.]|nr:PucR family transcriptional regulator [Eubacterium sp.]